MPAASFVDRVVLHLAAGHGGHGVASVKREKFKPLGGPDGGNGGKGGSVILRVDSQATTLLDYHHRPHQSAGNGKPGAGDERNGADGADLVLPVPPGTVVKDVAGHILVDLVADGQEHAVARGGRGGLGNKALASPRRKAPGFALLGEPGDALDVVLELKSLADVALIGFPSAGKSSLVSVLSAARPKIADYPFTTLVPNLGVVTAGDMRFTIADVPGLIPGAHLGRGLGLEFLRHVERCSVLAHVIDCATLEPGRDPLTDLDVIEEELAAYVPDADLGGRPLAERTRVIILNKADVPEARELAEMVKPGPRGAGLRGPHRVRRRAHRPDRAHVCARSPRDGGSGRLRRGRAAADRAAPPGGRRLRVRRSARGDAGRTRIPGGGGAPDPLGPADRLRQRRGRADTSPTGSAGSASRRPWSRPGPSRATPCSSARPTTRSSSTGSRR